MYYGKWYKFYISLQISFREEYLNPLIVRLTYVFTKYCISNWKKLQEIESLETGCLGVNLYY